eukprot:EG_transcript_48115
MLGSAPSSVTNVPRSASPPRPATGRLDRLDPPPTYPVYPYADGARHCSPPRVITSSLLPGFEPGLPFGSHFEAVRTPTTETLVLSLEEYFTHHCPDKLTSIYDPHQFAKQLLQR